MMAVIVKVHGRMETNDTKTPVCKFNLCKEHVIQIHIEEGASFNFRIYSDVKKQNSTE